MPFTECKSLWVLREKILINGFVYSNFNYCPLLWHFYSAKSVKKIKKKYNTELLQYFTMTFGVILNLK